MKQILVILSFSFLIGCKAQSDKYDIPKKHSQHIISISDGDLSLLLYKVDNRVWVIKDTAKVLKYFLEILDSGVAKQQRNFDAIDAIHRAEDSMEIKYSNKLMRQL